MGHYNRKHRGITGQPPGGGRKGITKRTRVQREQRARKKLLKIKMEEEAKAKNGSGTGTGDASTSGSTSTCDERIPKVEVTELKIENGEGSQASQDPGWDGQGQMEVENEDVEKDYAPVKMEGDEDDAQGDLVTLTLPPPSSTCFVCCAEIGFRIKSTFSKQLPKPEYYRSFLHDLLDIPISQSTTYLKELDNPENWLRLCKTCQLLIVNWVKAKEQIAMLEGRMKDCKKKIVGRMKETIGDPSRISLPRTPTGGTGTGKSKKRDRNHPLKHYRAMVKIQNFVAAKKYPFLRWKAKPIVKTSPPKKEKEVTWMGCQLGDTNTGRKAVGLGGRRSRRQAKEDPIPELKLKQSESVIEDEDFTEVSDYPVDEDEDTVQEVQEDPLAMEADAVEEKESRMIPGGQIGQLYCGLCNDDDANQVFENEEELISHTNTCHLAQSQSSSLPLARSNPSPSPIVNPVPRPRSSKSKPTTATKRRRKRVRGGEPRPKPSLEKPDDGKKRRKISKKGVGFNFIFKSYEYSCPNCPQIKGYSVMQYAQHLGIHLRRPYQCSKCMEFFPEDAELWESHWKDKHADQPGPDQNLIPPESISDHFVKIKFHPGAIWKCDNCFQGFYNEADRNEHENSNCKQMETETPPITKKKTHHLLPQACHLCQTTFRNFPEWRLHRAIHHPEADQMSCYFCDKSFLEKTMDGVDARHDTKLQKHMFSHAGDIYGNRVRILQECPSCGPVFDRESLHGKHFLEVHSTPANRSNRCHICQTTYCNFPLLKRHMSIHHFQSEASICDVCGLGCSQRIKLANHKLVQHGILPDPPEEYKIHVCLAEGCSYKAIEPNSLRYHVKTNHEEETRPHSCKLCGKAFKNSSKLRVHEEIHKNKDSKPYQCEICGNSFAVQNYLYIHKRLSHAGRTFPSTNRKRTPKAQAQTSSEPQLPPIMEPPPPVPNTAVAVVDMNMLM